MLKYVNTEITFSEVPDEITLCINISNCPCHCKGCHSPYLAEDIGIITIQENVTYIEIMNGKGPYVISEMQNRTIKGKTLKVRKAKK